MIGLQRALWLPSFVMHSGSEERAPERSVTRLIRLTSPVLKKLSSCFLRTALNFVKDISRSSCFQFWSVTANSNDQTRWWQVQALLYNNNKANEVTQLLSTRVGKPLGWIQIVCGFSLPLHLSHKVERYGKKSSNSDSTNTWWRNRRSSTLAL